MKKLCFGIILLVLILCAGCDDSPYEGPGKGADRLPPLEEGPEAAVQRQKSEFELALDEVVAARREVKISMDEGKTVTRTLNDSTGATASIAEANQEPCYADYWWTTLSSNTQLTVAVNAVLEDPEFKAFQSMGITYRHMPDRFAEPVRKAVEDFRATWQKGTVGR